MLSISQSVVQCFVPAASMTVSSPRGEPCLQLRKHGLFHASVLCMRSCTEVSVLMHVLTRAQAAIHDIADRPTTLHAQRPVSSPGLQGEGQSTKPTSCSPDQGATVNLHFFFKGTPCHRSLPATSLEAHLLIYNDRGTCCCALSSVKQVRQATQINAEPLSWRAHWAVPQRCERSLDQFESSCSWRQLVSELLGVGNFRHRLGSPLPSLIHRAILLLQAMNVGKGVIL